MLTEIQQPDIVRQPVAHEIGAHSREHDLAAMRRGHEPAGAVERKTEVVTVALVADAGVDPYADAKRAGGGIPHLGGKRARDIRRGQHGVRRRRKHRVNTVTG